MSLTQKTPGNTKKPGSPDVPDALVWRIKELSTFNVSSLRERWDPALESLHKQTNATLAEIFGIGSSEYKRFTIDPFDSDLQADFSGRYTPEELQQAVRENLDKAIVRLTQVKALLLERARQKQAAPSTPPAAPAPKTPVAPPAAPAPKAPVAPPPPAPKASVAPTAPAAPKAPMTPPPPVSTPAPPKAPVQPEVKPRPAATPTADGRITVIAQHDPQTRHAIMDFLDQLGLPATTGGAAASPTDGAFLNRLDVLTDIQFAIVLLPEGDLDAATGLPRTLSPGQALELGFLLGSLGRTRICFLMPEEAATDNAVSGFSTVPLDGEGLWRLLLARTLKQAGVDVDLNRAL